jgi:hypothetical protein
MEHDSIKNFLRYDSHGNTSFNAYLSSIGITDIFNMNQNICLETLYRITIFSLIILSSEK